MIVESLDDQTNEAMHDLIDEARMTDSAATTSALYAEYTLGHHRPVASHERKLMLGSNQLGDVFENMIGRCVHELNGRIRFREFEVNDAEVADFLRLDVVAKNQLDRAVSALIPRVLTDGNAAMSVSWRGGTEGRPYLHHERWWDGNTGMFVAVSDTGEVFWAVSEWLDRQERRYRTVYRPHVIERFRLEGDGWQRETEIDWTFNGKPLGVPVAHFPNGASPYGPYAESTVAKVIDVQDALNASLFNRQLVSAMTGSQIYTATGVDETSELPVGAGIMWRAQNPQAEFGAVPPGDMDALIKETDDLRAVIGGEFNVPVYRIGQGDWPSGVALVRADAPMIKRCQLLIDMVKPGLVYLQHRAVEMKNVFGGGSLNEGAVVTCDFYEPDEIDPGTRVEIDQAKADLYQSMINLPEVLIQKLDVLTGEELTKLRTQLAVAEADRVVADAGANGSF